MIVCSLVAARTVPAQTWSQLVTAGTGPSTSVSYKATNYDSTNDRLIVFLPEGNSVPSQVWVLTNANGLGGTPTWTQLQPTGAAPETNGLSTAVYDEPANQLIVYGGCYANCSPALPNVYVLTNANGLGGTPSWSQSSPGSSIPRDDQAAVYDPTTNSMIVFGGSLAFYGTDQNDTYTLSPANGSSPTWTTLATSGGPPGVREGASAVYDQRHNRMVIFGGIDGISTCCPYNSSDYNDVWVLSNANGHGGTPTWTELEPEGTPPAPRSGHSAVYDPAENTMYVFGGDSWSNPNQSDTLLGDVWKLSNANGLGTTVPTWTQIGQFGTPPGATSGQGAALDTVNRVMISYGGEDRNFNPFFLTFILDLEQH